MNWRRAEIFSANEIEIVSFRSVINQIINGSNCEINLIGPRHVTDDFDQP